MTGLQICREDWENAVEQRQHDFKARQQTGKQHQAAAPRTAQNNPPIRDWFHDDFQDW
jgi:hypothetical protein